MAAPRTQQKRPLEAWSGDGLAEALIPSRTRGGIWALEGIAEEQVYALFPELRRALEERGMLLLGMDPTGSLVSTRTFAGVIDAFVREIERRGSISAEIEELLEWLHAARGGEQDRLLAHEREAVLTDTLSQLWGELSEIMPAALFVFYPHRCASQVEHQLTYLARYYFNDPIEELAPEFEAGSAARGALVGITQAGERPSFLGPELVVGALDAAEHIEQSVREYLARPEVVRHLVETTRGDLGRLEDLVEHLGADVHHLWMRRVDELGEQARALAELLAVSGEPVEMSLAHQAIEGLAATGYFSSTVRGLIEVGLANRVVQMGSVRLGLVDPDLGEALAGALAQPRRQQLHEALYRAALAESEQSGGEDIVFVTRHALAAGAQDVALEYGVRAGRKLFGEGALEEAARILGQLLEHATEEVARAELHAMAVEVWARLGRWRHALRHCGYLKRFVAGARGRAELALRTASLLGRMSHYETAARVLEGVLDEIDCAGQLRALCARVETERGEAAFKLGRYEQARRAAGRALAALEEAASSGAIQAHERDRALIQARNLLGKVEILVARHDQAVALFEQNLELARQRHWDSEIARVEGNLGIVAMQRFEYDEAIERLEHTLGFSKHSHLVQRSNCLLNLAVIHHYRFEYEEALSCNLEALRVARQNDEAWIYSNATLNLAMLYRDMGALERAGLMLEHLEDRDAPQHNTYVAGNIRSTRASLAAERGDYERVVALLSERVEQAERSTDEDIIGVGRTYQLKLALAYLELKQWSRARELLESYREDPEREEPNLEALRLLIQGRLQLDQDGQAEQAAGIFLQAAELAEQIGNFREATRAGIWRAEALEAQGEREAARRELRARAEAVCAHAERVPAGLRADFLGLALHDTLRAVAHDLDVDVPEALAHYKPQAAADADPSGPVDDEDWRRWRARYADIVGETPRLHQIFRVIDRVAASETTMLLLGESGTGKELIAEAIHAQSDRADGPLIKVNCAAFVESLLLSELFGHEKGAFTGAVNQKIGRFERADGGTLFLDEIADISPQTQVALLRVLQEQAFERVGGAETLEVDVRVICATNKDLEQMVREGSFRLDLYYRLKGMVLELPALRERRADIPRLVESFASRFGDAADGYTFEREAMRELVRYSWPGNVRELQNFIKSSLLFVEGARFGTEHIAEFEDFFTGGEFTDADVSAVLDEWETWRAKDSTHPPLEQIEPAPSAHAQATEAPIEDPEDALVDQIIAQGLSLTRLKKRLEMEAIRRAITETEGNVTQAAKLLKMKRPRLSQIINGDPDLAALKAELVGK